MAKKNSEQEVNTEEMREDIELQQQIAALRRKQDAQDRKKKRLSMIAFVLVFLLLSVMWGRDIIRLKAENIALKKQQAALEEQRDELKEELTRVDDPEYIKEQARKQLRLLNPGEILFTFDDDGSGAGEEAGESGGSDE